MEAYADDDEVAAAVADLDGSVPAPRLSEWTPERDELTRAVDRLGELIALTVQIHGQPLRIEPRPRPVTAFDRARRDRRYTQHHALVRRLLPGEVHSDGRL